MLNIRHIAHAFNKAFSIVVLEQVTYTAGKPK